MIVAETPTGKIWPFGMASLQWGRDLIVAETRLTPVLSRLRGSRLQWGRDLIVAETRPDQVRLVDDDQRFNGAAT